MRGKGDKEEETHSHSIHIIHSLLVYISLYHLYTSLLPSLYPLSLPCAWRRRAYGQSGESAVKRRAAQHVGRVCNTLLGISSTLSHPYYLPPWRNNDPPSPMNLLKY